VRALVSGGGYNIQDIPGSIKPQKPEDEYRMNKLYEKNNTIKKIGG
jgi:hypothetical protein